MKKQIIGLLGLLLAACNPQTQSSLDVVKQAFALLEQAPHYRILALASLDKEALLFYTLDYLAPNRLHYTSATAEAIAIGSTYYDRFGDGSWNVGNTDTYDLSDKLEPADFSQIVRVEARSDILAAPNLCYKIVTKSAAVDDWKLCVKPDTHQLIFQYFEQNGETLVLRYDFDTPIVIQPPI